MVLLVTPDLSLPVSSVCDLSDGDVVCITDEKGHSGGGGGVEAGGHGSSGHSRLVIASQQCV